MIRKLLLGITLVLSGVVHSQIHQADKFEVRDISVDSLTIILKNSFAPVNDPKNFKIKVTPNSDKVSHIDEETENEFIRKNIKRYLAGDTLYITSKKNNSVFTYIIHRSQ